MATDKTKDVKCIDCGKDIKVHVFASPKTSRCPDCKEAKYGKKAKKVEQIAQETKATGGTVSTVSGEQITGPRIDGKPNTKLRNLHCPYCDTRMDIIGVIKNEHWGDIVSFQCRTKGCWTVVQISEQSKMAGPWRTTACGTSFEVDDLKNHLQHGEMDEWCEQHNVEQRHTTGL